MGILEEKSRKRTKKENIQKAVLATISIAGILSLAAIAPNTIQCLKSFGIIPTKRHRDAIRRSRDQLIKNNLLKYEGNFLRLTKKGQAKLHSFEIRDWKFDKPKKWDEKWRMLIFDIPEKRKPLRNKIRYTLLDIGFLRLQDSVWIYPYACEDLVSLLKADFKIGKDLLYIIADSVENDKTLRETFGLPKSL